MSTEVENPYKRYRADAERVSAMLDAVAKLDGRMKARRGKLKTFAEDLAKQQEGSRDDGRGEHTKLGESGNYFNNRAWAIRRCGRTARGVALVDSPTAGASEKVFHAPCRDRLCPMCNARINSHGAAAYGRLIRETLDRDGRLFFFTLTVKHAKGDTLKATRKALDKAWGLLIRRKEFRDTWQERLRIAEVEYTADGGWHPHFHGLALLDPTSKAQHLPRIELERRMKAIWAKATARQGRLSHAVDFRELVPHSRNDAGEIVEVRYWIRPADRARMIKLAKAGKIQLHSGNGNRGMKGHLYRVQQIADIVSELTKYVTKRKADGMKPHQVSLYDWTPKLLHEYALGVRGWNLRRASRGWADVLLDFDQDEILAREQQEAEAAGYDYYSWAEIVDDCKRAQGDNLTRQQVLDFGNVYRRILHALDREGCDISADQIRPWIAGALYKGTDEPLTPLMATPWQRKEKHFESHSERLAELGHDGLNARHFRILLHLGRQRQAGRSSNKLRGFGMSKQRLERTLAELAMRSLVEVEDGALQLADGGAGLLKSMTGRAHEISQPKPEYRKQIEQRRQAELAFAGVT